ncbi:MAG: hypothetical protein AAF514_03815 [Verrucomicrobiota bacterium]
MAVSFVGSSLADEPVDSEALVARMKETLAAAGGAAGEAEGEEGNPDFTTLLLEDPKTIDLTTLSLFSSSLPFADLFSVKLKLFEAEDDTSMGVAWKFAKSVSRNYFEDSLEAKGGLDLSLTSTGNVAFDEDVNPRDFLVANASLSFFRSTGGLFKGLPKPDDEVARERFRLARELAEGEDLGKTMELIGMMRDQMSTQVYVEGGFDLGYESDQAFDNQNWTFGAHLGLDIKAWNDDYVLARWNLLDYPFALTRWAFGSETRFRPSGAALPSFLVGLDYVTPTAEDGLRMGDMSSFFRFKAEVAHRSMVADIGGQPIYFETNLRYFRELDPTRTIQDLGQDEKLLFTAAIEFPNNMYVSYSIGELPFELKDERVFALGWQYKF